MEFTGREILTRTHDAQTTLYTTKMAYNASLQLEYIGEAEPGSGAGSLLWRIKKITYDGSGLQTDVQWAEGTRSFDKEWDERENYAYS